MSSALKALKKLRKKALKHESKNKTGDRALQQLSRPAVLPIHHHLPAKPVANDSVWRELSQDVFSSILGEVSKPLRPLLDWFNHSGSTGLVSNRVQAKSNSSTSRPFSGSVRIATQPVQTAAALHLPFKSPPCERCPAKMGGVCQCAAKRFGTRSLK
ncbi:hypothetical protein [Budvicia diplopodorum]|uniref:hypothetical protein n=1 Tax=Budvicia diplopodorum TaxID=1119056 RepID=UPI00135B61E3|nr:hypothetical protein [Budvicia diplopodorum]